MPTKSWITRLDGRIALALVFGLLLVLSVRQVEDPDVGFHLKSGEAILSGAGFPTTDRFTYTLGDQPDIDLYWAYQTMLALVEHRLDAPGLVGLHALLIFLTFLTLYRTGRLGSQDPALLAGLALLGILASELRFEVRPEVVSYLLLALVLHLLHRRALNLTSPLWLLPLIHLVWANAHGFFVAGWAAQACFLIGGGYRNRRLDRPLAGWGLASVGACLINPYGWKALWFPLTLAGRLGTADLFKQTIGEMASPFALRLSEQYPFFPRFPVLCFQLFALLSLMSIPVLLRRRRFDLVLLSAIFSVPAASMLRNMPLLVVTSLPGVALAGGEGVSLIGSILRPDARSRLRAGALVGIMVASGVLGLRVVHDAYYIAGRRPTRFGWDWNHLTLPLDAVEYARKTGLTGRVFNHLSLGGTLAWKLPQPLFIHAHLEVIGEDFYREYLRSLASEEALEDLVRRYQIQWAIYPYGTHPDLLSRMSRDPRWKLAYSDPLAVIFLRSDSPMAARVAAGSAAHAGGEPPDTAGISLPGLGSVPRAGSLVRWLRGLARHEVFPSEDLDLGLFHFYQGDLVLAGRHFARAIHDSGGAYYELYANLAPCLYSEGRMAQGMACDQVVLQDDPHSRLARDRLALVRAMGPAAFQKPKSSPSRFRTVIE